MEELDCSNVTLSSEVSLSAKVLRGRNLVVRCGSFKVELGRLARSWPVFSTVGSLGLPPHLPSSLQGFILDLHLGVEP